MDNQNTSRRRFLTTSAAAAGSALLSASALGGTAPVQPQSREADTLYGHGMVWNRELPGEAGQLNLSIDLRTNLETGEGFGTLSDPLYPDWDMHFKVTEVDQRVVPRTGQTRYTLWGVVTDAKNPALVGQPVRMLAQTVGDTTAIAVAIGDGKEKIAFTGAGLVVIAIIAILIGLLLPAVQKVR